MEFMESIRRWACLAGLLGLAAGSVVLQTCTRASPGSPDGSTDSSTPPDAAVDAGIADAEPSRDAQTPDARLWDVICE